MSDPRDTPEDWDEVTASDRASKRRANGGAAVPVTRQAVAGQLKSLFAELTSGPMPDHLLALVDQLEACQPSEDDAEGVTRNGAASPGPAEPPRTPPRR